MDINEITDRMGWDDDSIRLLMDRYICRTPKETERFRRWWERTARAECREAGVDFDSLDT